MIAGRYIDGDILHVGAGIVLHQANCLGKTGGLAGALRARYPAQFAPYFAECARFSHRPERLLGTAIMGKAEAGGVIVVHVLGQLRFGWDRPHTDLDAVRRALNSARAQIAQCPELARLPVFAPFLMGCGRGGGNWNDYLPILQENFPSVIIVRRQEDRAPTAACSMLPGFAETGNA